MIRRFLPALLALICASASAEAQQPTALQQAVEAVQSHYPDVHAWLVSRGDQIAASGDGFEIYGTSTETGRSGVFELTGVQPWGAVTEQVLAVMAMQQVEAGRLSLDAPASTYLPDLAGTERAPTIRELLQHRSGLWNPDDGPMGPYRVSAFYMANGNALRPCLAGRSPPGGSARPNICDDLVLGRILERVTGKRLPALLRERIANPAGLASVRFGGEQPRINEAWTWDRTEERMFARIGAAGGLIGSIADLNGFDRALMDGRLLSAASREVLWRADPALGDLALGQWVFDAQPQGCARPLRIVERRGVIGQYLVRNIIVPERDLVVILFARRPGFDFGDTRQSGVSHDMLAAVACA